MTRVLAFAVLLVTGCASSRPIAVHSTHEPASVASTDQATMETLPEWVRIPDWAESLDGGQVIDTDGRPVATINSLIVYIDGPLSNAESAQLGLIGGDRAVIAQSSVDRFMAKIGDRDGASLLSSPAVSLVPKQKAMLAVVNNESGTVMFLKTRGITPGRCAFDFSIQCLGATNQSVPSEAHSTWELAGHADLAVGEWYQRVRKMNESGPTAVVLVGLDRIAYPEEVHGERQGINRIRMADTRMLAEVDPRLRTPMGEDHP